MPGLQPVEQVIAALADERTLLVLDNCEHLLEPCAVLTAGLVAQHAAVNVIATAREPLGVPGEVTWRVAIAVGAARPDVSLPFQLWGSTTPSDCSSTEPAGLARPLRSPRRTLRPSRRSAFDSMAFRSPWSWRPPDAGRCRRSGSRRSSTIDSISSPAVPAPCCRDSRRWRRPSTGATTGWTRTSRCSSVDSGCSPDCFPMDGGGTRRGGAR